MLPAAENMGIGVLAYMPVAGGLLTGQKSSQEGSRTAQVENEYGMKVDRDEQFAAYSDLCREIGQKEATVAIAWTLSSSAVASAIVGVRTLEHLEGLEEASGLELESGVLERLEEIFGINEGRPLKPGPAPEAYSW